MNHSLFMLANNKLFKKGQYGKVLKVNIILVIISNVLGITSLFICGYGQVENIILNIFLLIPFIIGIFMFIIRMYYKNKNNKLKDSIIKITKRNRG